MKTSKYSIISIAIFSFLLFSCDDFLDVNTSLDRPESTSPNYLLPAVLGNMSSAHYEQGETAAYISQYVTTITGGSSFKDRWDYRNAYRIGLWRKNYFDVAGNANKMINIAKEEGSDNYIGVGLTMKALSFLTTTDLFGDMPVDDAFSGIYNPTYDDQSMVYSFVDKWLDEAINAFGKSDETDRAINITSDRVYAGDLLAWESFAHGIKARMYIHTANFDGGYSRVLDQIDMAYENWKDPEYNYKSDPVNDWERNSWGPSKARPQWDFVSNFLNGSVSTNFFMDAMNLSGEIDPRLAKLTTPGKNGKYLSVPASEGLRGLSQRDFANLYNGYWTKDDSPIIWMTKEELNFIEAEAAFYSGDKNRSLDAYKRGIKNNLLRLDVTLDTINLYMKSPAVAQTTADLTISSIMMQKYIALYLQPETWTDMRRYKYSNQVYADLKYPKNALSIYNGEFIQRIPYDPQTEYIYNPKEIERLQAKDPLWVVKKVWWAENSTL